MISCRGARARGRRGDGEVTALVFVFVCRLHMVLKTQSDKGTKEHSVISLRDVVTS